jgi:hypothetical protein
MLNQQERENCELRQRLDTNYLVEFIMNWISDCLVSSYKHPAGVANAIKVEVKEKTRPQRLDFSPFSTHSIERALTALQAAQAAKLIDLPTAST